MPSNQSDSKRLMSLPNDINNNIAQDLAKEAL